MINSLICHEKSTLLDVLKNLQKSGKGIAFLVDDAKVATGVLTDGDIRLALLKGYDLQVRADKVMNRDFVFAGPKETPKTIASKFSKKIKLIPVLDNQGRVVDYCEFVAGVNLPVAIPDLDGKEFRYLVDAFLSTWISSKGKYLSEFENKFSAFCDCTHGVAVSNGTVALHLALKTLGIGKGDEVIVPDLTFAATINAVLQANATPVIVDVEPDSWCLDPAEVKKAITSKTKAILPVHLYGQPCEMGSIMALAKKHGLPVIEDCAEAHGASYNGKKVGSVGTIGCFSFYGNKVITTGEGGMCTTRSSSLDKKMRLLRDHGMSERKKYWHTAVGYNYRMTNLQAAIGLAQTERIGKILRDRRQIELRYRNALKGLDFIEFQRDDLPKRKKITWLVCILVHGRNRDGYIKQLQKNGLETRPFFYPLSDMPIYQKYVFSNKYSVQISRRGINLPTFSRLKEIKKEWFNV